jgi:hypothetical protein
LFFFRSFAAATNVARITQDAIGAWCGGRCNAVSHSSGPRAVIIQTDSHLGSAQMPKELCLEPHERPGDICRTGVRIVAAWLAQSVAQRTVKRQACARPVCQAWEGCARVHTCWLVGSPS